MEHLSAPSLSALLTNIKPVADPLKKFRSKLMHSLCKLDHFSALGKIVNRCETDQIKKVMSKFAPFFTHRPYSQILDMLQVPLINAPFL
jgi:hypothetical protein